MSLRGTIDSEMSEAPTQARTDARRPRSDAAANRERILAAATIAVRRDGEKVPMATIAEEAGVGIGTLYRHYPTRPALLAALTLRSFQLVLQHARAAAQATSGSRRAHAILRTDDRGPQRVRPPAPRRPRHP